MSSGKESSFLDMLPAPPPGGSEESRASPGLSITLSPALDIPMDSPPLWYPTEWSSPAELVSVRRIFLWEP